MNEQPKMGVNRTGVQISPMDAGSMASDIERLMPQALGDTSPASTLRSSYIVEAEPVGSVPVPGALKGAFATGVSMLAGNSPQLLLDKLGAIRDEEARHMELVAGAIMSLGGDPTSMAPCADIAGVEAMGLVHVLNDPRSPVVQSLHAILVVELTDNNGWEMLILLARQQNREDMAAQSGIALERERGHLQHVQAWFQQAMLSGAGGNAADMALPDAGSAH